MPYRIFLSSGYLIDTLVRNYAIFFAISMSYDELISLVSFATSSLSFVLTLSSIFSLSGSKRFGALLPKYMYVSASFKPTIPSLTKCNILSNRSATSLSSF